MMMKRLREKEPETSPRSMNAVEADSLIAAADAIAQVAAEMGCEQYLVFGLSREPEREEIEEIRPATPYGAVIAEQEREMATIARSLHDDTVHSLACALTELEIAMSEAGLGQGPRDSIASAIDYLDAALKGVLDASCSLHPPVIDSLGLQAALRGLVKRMNAVYRTDFKLVSIGKDGEVPDEVELNLYRIAQEALRNVAEHSGAKEALVFLNRSYCGIDLVISDDGGGVSDGGTGCSVAAVGDGSNGSPAYGERTHLGLASIRERAESIGATFGCRNDHRGVTLKVHVPLARPGL